MRSRVALEGTGLLDRPETCSQAKLRPPVSSSLSRADSIQDAYVGRPHRAGIRGGDCDPRHGAATARPGGQRLCPHGKRVGGPGKPLTGARLSLWGGGNMPCRGHGGGSAAGAPRAVTPPDGHQSAPGAVRNPGWSPSPCAHGGKVRPPGMGCLSACKHGPQET